MVSETENELVSGAEDELVGHRKLLVLYLKLVSETEDAGNSIDRDVHVAKGYSTRQLNSIKQL